MRPSRRAFLTALWAIALSVLAAGPAHAQLVGTDTSPGESCAGVATGATRMTADADQDGGQVILICDGTTWNAMSSYGLPACPTQDILVSGGAHGWRCSSDPPILGTITASAYGGTGQLSSGTGNPTITNLSIGSPSSQRWVVAAIQSDANSGSTRTISSATIGGISATIAGQKSALAGTEVFLTAVVYAPVPSGTTTDVSWIFSGDTMNRHVAWVYTIEYDGTDFALQTTDTTSLAHTAGTVTIGAVTDSTGSFNITWTNATEASENDFGNGSASSGYRLHSTTGDVTVSTDAGNAKTIVNFAGEP